jgi:excisionase family DNA binding protein
MPRTAQLTAPHQLITVEDVATRWKVHPRTVRRRIASGDLTAYRVGPHLIRLDSDEVDAMLRPIPAAGAVVQ